MGKSRMFHLTGLIQGGITLIVTALLALSADQVLKGNKTTYQRYAPICVNLDVLSKTEEVKLNKRSNKHSDWKRVKFLFACPQTVDRWKVRFKVLVDQSLLRFIVIDKYHFITEYRHGFCTEYNRLVNMLWDIL